MSKSRSMHTCALHALWAATFLSVAAYDEQSARADADPTPPAIDAPSDDGLPGKAPDAPPADSVVRKPSGAYISRVTAYGTGCAAGTWDVNLNADGRSFDVTFAEFFVEVDRSRAVSVKNCTLSIDLHSPEGLSYTVDTMGFNGWTYLEEGVQMRQQTSYYFQGHPDEGETVTTDLVGPREGDFLVLDTREDVNLVRSRCGKDQTLNINMMLRLLNTESPRRNGFTSIESIPQRPLSLSWKRC